MILKFKDIHNDEVEVDFSKVQQINQCRLADNSPCCDLISDAKGIPYLDGSIDDLILKTYRFGYDSGYEKGKSEAKIFTADIEVVPDEDEPILPKGWFESVCNTDDIDDKTVTTRRAIKASEVICIREGFDVYDNAIVYIALANNNHCIVSEPYETVMAKYLKALGETE